jgi:short-subunit dehydrogenase
MRTVPECEHITKLCVTLPPAWNRTPFNSPPSVTPVAAKAFVTSFSEAVHVDAKGDRVHVTALRPGLMHTEFQSVSNTEGSERRFLVFAWFNSEKSTKKRALY